MAISMLPDIRRNIRQKKARLLARFPEIGVYFYDTLTHPLGSPDLKVELDE